MSEWRVRHHTPAALQDTPNYMELMKQINTDELSWLSDDGDWSDSQGQRVENDSSNSEVKNIEGPDKTATHKCIVYVVHQPAPCWLKSNFNISQMWVISYPIEYYIIWFRNKYFTKNFPIFKNVSNGQNYAMVKGLKSR